MSTYYVITAEVQGSLKTGLVSEDEFENNPEDFFVPSARNVEVHGTVNISGEAEHMLPGCIVEE